MIVKAGGVEKIVKIRQIKFTINVSLRGGANWVMELGSGGWHNGCPGRGDQAEGNG